MSERLSPYERMASMYAANPQEMPFEWYCQWHAKHAFFFSTPDFIIMGRPMLRGDLVAQGVSLRVYSRHIADTWYVHAMAGDLRAAWSILPWPLPWLAWERLHGGKKDLRFYRFEEIRRLTNHEVPV